MGALEPATINGSMLQSWHTEQTWHTHRVAFEEGSGPRVLLKGGPGNRGRSACGPTHVARLECHRETGLILRCAGKAGNPFQTKQGNRPSRRDQEGRRGSEEAVPGPSVFPSGEPGVSGDFWLIRD